jgi:hypothetical protein
MPCAAPLRSAAPAALLPDPLCPAAHSFFSTSSASLSTSSSSESLSAVATVPSSSALMALASSNFFLNSCASGGGGGRQGQGEWQHKVAACLHEDAPGVAAPG